MSGEVQWRPIRQWWGGGGASLNRADHLGWAGSCLAAYNTYSERHGGDKGDEQRAKERESEREREQESERQRSSSPPFRLQDSMIVAFAKATGRPCLFAIPISTPLSYDTVSHHIRCEREREGTAHLVLVVPCVLFFDSLSRFLSSLSRTQSLLRPAAPVRSRSMPHWRETPVL